MKEVLCYFLSRIKAQNSEQRKREAAGRQLFLLLCHDRGIICNTNSVLNHWDQLPLAAVQMESKRDPVPESSSVGLGISMTKPPDWIRLAQQFRLCMRGAPNLQTSTVPSPQHHTVLPAQESRPSLLFTRA